MPEFRFESPWLLLAALPLIAGAAWALWRTSSPLRPARALIGGGALLVASLCLLLLASGFGWRDETGGRTFWILLDRSLSMGDAAERRLPGLLEELRAAAAPEDFVGVIGFADSADVLMPPTAAQDVDPAFEPGAAQPSDETWLSAAIELAARTSMPGTAPVALLVSDGHDSAARYGGDAAAGARDRGVVVYPVAVDSRPAPEVALADFNARIAGSDDRTLAVDIVIQSTVAQYVVPQLRVNGRQVSAGSRLDERGGLNVGAGRTPLRLRIDGIEEMPVYIVEVALAARQDTYPGNNAARLAVRSGGEGWLLLLHGNSGRERALERALQRADIPFRTGPAALLPSDHAELQRYQALILCDLRADQVSTSQMSAIARFTRDGGGLAMIGGPDSFAPGGWFETQVEAVLPVTCDVTDEGEQQRPAVVVVFDRSGSMSAQVGGVSKMDLANEGASRAIDLLPPGSLFGLLSVDTQAEWIVPLQPLEDRRRARAAALGNTVGGGGIYVDVAMREALHHLLAADATSRHIVLFSDGADTERQGGVLEQVSAAHGANNVTVTTICLGDGKDREFLEELARVGRGRFFFVNDAADLPAVFSREAALSGGMFIREETFRPVPGLPGALTRGIDFESEQSPPLLGYVAVTERTQADVWLWADEDRNRPLLATWHVGLGRSLAFTSDARDRWADQWLTWDGFDDLWQRWARWLMAEAGSIRGVESEWTATQLGPELHLRFYDDSGLPRDLDSPSATATLADGTNVDVELLPFAAGEYRARLRRAGSGVYSVTVQEAGEDGQPRPAARESRIFVPVEELIAKPADLGLLGAVAEATGGRLIASAREAATADLRGGYRDVQPRGTLLALAMAGLLLALGARRFPSVWRRRDESTPEPEPSIETAAAAYGRVVKQRRERETPAYAVAPRIREIEPAKEQATPAPATGSLLSAMRKVRKDLGKQERE